jgi:hypothetical protein
VVVKDTIMHVPSTTRLLVVGGLLAALAQRLVLRARRKARVDTPWDLPSGTLYPAAAQAPSGAPLADEQATH